jgi:ribose/xylose/arabinose/galactoside ABC-type transport system permease subunit
MLPGTRRFATDFRLPVTGYQILAATRNLKPVTHLGRFLIFLGVGLFAIGSGLLLLGKAGLPLGRLPGDFTWRGRNTTVYFPLGTCIFLSVVLSLVFYVISRLRK